MSSQERRPRGGLRGFWTGSAARELAATLLLGALGAGLVFVASRQAWGYVRTTPPKPLPASNVAVTGAQLVPYADALVLAGLATLAAILASRGLLRRITGVLLAGIGAGLAAAAVTITQAGAISAANANVGPATAAAGSVLDGGNVAAPAVPNVAGTVPRVAFAATGWQTVVLLGAIAMVGAGLLVVYRAGRLAVMSSRYDSPAAAGKGSPASRPAPQQLAASPGTAGRAPADSAAIWEALSRGDDPTVTSASPGEA